MTWDVLQHTDGTLQMVPHGDPVPEGWALVVETANPDYLEYMAAIAVG